jgi:hypothetical protein
MTATDQSTTKRIEPHPIAALLTPEMKERVRATTFYRTRTKRIAALMPNNRRVCPLGVAVGLTGMEMPDPWAITERLGLSYEASTYEVNRQQRLDVFGLISQFDKGEIDPADVHALLGCAEAQP